MQQTTQNIILNIENLTCGYGGKPIIENFSLQVSHGETVAITGPNGCGKSTLLKAIYQLCIIEQGVIEYNKQSLNNKTPESIKKLGIAYFMQRNTIFPTLNIKENLYLSLNGFNKKIKDQRVQEVINHFPVLGTRLNKPAGLLSGGQRQQLAMGMLIAQNADLWLLDEPTSGLDNERSEYFLQLLLQHTKKSTGNSKTIIFVEHKTQIISNLANRIVKL